MSYPQLFALVIGINKYLPAYTSLTYARQDADRFENFLISIEVPSANIISLRDDKANRIAILSAFQSLTTNEKILKDDPIVIYYAGHGGRVPKPDTWADWPTNGPNIEIMCPSDMGTTVDGKTVDGIPDRTISALLQELSIVKGDNITLILDCCSSAGMSRSALPSPMDGIIRQIFNPPRMGADCDRSVWERGPQTVSTTRGLGTYRGFSKKHQESHVLLAACGVDQSAVERPGIGGIFTHQLLRILEEESLGDLTYVSLMHKLQMPRGQTPHCEGRNVGRRFFNNRTPGANRSFSLGRRDDDTDELILNLGDVHGVTIGSVYGVHATILDPGPDNPEMFTLVITRVEPLHSIMEFPDEVYDIPELFYARKIANGPAKPFAIYCSDKDFIEGLFPDQQSCSNYGITIVSSPTFADFSMLVDNANGIVNFERHNSLVVPHIGSRLPFSMGMDKHSALRKVIECAVNFDRHLKRSGEDMRDIWLEIREVEFESVPECDTHRTPRNIGRNLFENDIAVVPVDKMFSLTISNQTSLALYPHVFVLDPSELSIDAWYTPAIGGRPGKSGLVDPPMLPKSVLTLGYGPTATYPWEFSLRAGESVDVVFLKIFFTTSPSDFSTLLQSNPFESSGVSRTGQPIKPSSPVAEFWGTKLATVVHKRF